MAKYIYTSGKRNGLVYQEYYYLRKGENIVQKKNFYCPVNTKWLSKDEFRQYILQLIKDYYPNYLVVQQLPEDFQEHVIYFVYNCTVSDTDYYDIYVLKDNVVTKIDLYANSGGLTPEIQAYIDNKFNEAKSYTDSKIPHLYLHKFTYDCAGTGEVNFTFFNNSSSYMDLTGIFNYLTDLDCTSHWKGYPASGVGPNYETVVSIYGGMESSGSMVVRGFYVACIKNDNYYYYWYTRFMYDIIERIKQIF